jgi:hypothetical protein
MSFLQMTLRGKKKKPKQIKKFHSCKGYWGTFTEKYATDIAEIYK